MRGRAGLLAPALVALLLPALAACGAGTGGPRADPGRRLLVIGVDGAAWDQILPLMAAGELPHLRRLAESGYSARLTTMAPALSPVVWTTIATGKAPHQHGVRGFLARDPETGEGVPVTSNMRRASALWNMLGDAGVDVGVVGWWVTWPAEEVRGWMISPYAAPGQTTWKGTLYADGREDQTWPRGLLPTLEPVIEGGVGEARETFPELFPPLPEGSAPDYIQAFLKDTLWVHVSDTIFRDVGEWLVREHAPRFAAVYLGGVDVTGHRFWRFARPHPETWPVAEAEVAAYGDSLARYYRWTDAAIGRLLAAAPPDTTVLVLSDHGMEEAEVRDRPVTEWNQHPHEISGGHTAGPDGMLLLSGPGAARNFDPGLWGGDGSEMPRIGTPGHPGVLDVAPSILHFYGLPVGEDMAGQVQTALFEAGIAGRPVARIGTWDDPDRLPDPTPVSSPRMDEVKDRLRGLGYID